MNMFGFVLGILSSFLIVGLAEMTDVECDSLFTIVTYMLLVQFICSQMEK